MSLDERAQQARAALAARAGEIALHRQGLALKRWVAPTGAVTALVAVVLVVVFIAGLVSDGPEQVESAAGVEEHVQVVGGVTGPIVAGFVSGSGDITVLIGDPLAPTVERLAGATGAPVLGVETIPEPRWSFDGRVIEYVSDLDGDLQVVRVDVRTGRSTTSAYWMVADLDAGTEPEEEDPVTGEILNRPENEAGPSSEIPSLLEDQRVLSGSVVLMRGALGPLVTAIKTESATQWRVGPAGSDRSLFLEIESTRFLAPTRDSLIVVAGGSLSTISATGELNELEQGGVSNETVTSAAEGPNGELAYGLSTGAVVVSRAEGSERIDFDIDAGPVGAISWDPSGETVIAQSSEPDKDSLHLCVVASATCTALGLGAAERGSLVRGIPTPPPLEFYAGFWPEPTQGSADAATLADDAPAWRFDPELLATQFARVVFGWSDPVVGDAPEIRRFVPYSVSFEVRPSPREPSVTVTATQVAAQSGWAITGVSSPIQSLRSGYSAQGPVTIGFDRKGATTADVILGIGETTYSQNTDLDEVQFNVEDPIVGPSYFLILFRDDQGEVFAANSGSLDGPPYFVSIG